MTDGYCQVLRNRPKIPLAKDAFREARNANAHKPSSRGSHSEIVGK
jgi:hypothetical protein